MSRYYIDDHNINGYDNYAEAFAPVHDEPGANRTALDETNGFYDCWVKLYRRPDIDPNGETVFYDADSNVRVICSVRRPGQHPGGHAWWLTPLSEYCPRL